MPTSLRAFSSAVALAGLVLLFPGLAEACAVCFSGEEANRIAYLVTTAFLTFTPLLLVGFCIFLLRRHILRKAAEAEDFGVLSAQDTVR